MTLKDVTNVTSVTGIDETKMNDFVKVHSNPAKDEFIVELADLPGNCYLEARLYNSFSSMVLKIKNNNEKDDILRFNTSALPSGVYILQITKGNHVYSSKVIISN